MDIIIKPNSKEYQFIHKDEYQMVEIAQGENILYGRIKNISSNGTYIIEIMEKNNV